MKIEQKYIIPLSVAGVILAAGISYAAFNHYAERGEHSSSKYEHSESFEKGKNSGKNGGNSENQQKMGGNGNGEEMGNSDQQGQGNKQENQEDEHQVMSDEDHKAQDEKMINDFPTEELSQAEIDALTQMGEEEYLARDVYRALFDKWGIKTFGNIQASEEKHAQAITILQEKYGLDTFADHQEGVFEDDHIQGLYDTLVAQGSVSELEAIKVGMTIEDLDIYDLEKLVEEVDNQDITKVFENLTRGSRNHMRSFNKQLLKQGGEYEAQYITAEKMQEIITGEHEAGDHTGGTGGNGGQGQGSGQGSGQGQGMGKGRQ